MSKHRGTLYVLGRRSWWDAGPKRRAKVESWCERNGLDLDDVFAVRISGRRRGVAWVYAKDPDTGERYVDASGLRAEWSCQEISP